LSISNFSAPIIPYLQKNFEKPAPEATLPGPGKPKTAEPVVLVPDLVIEVKGQEDFGSVCLTWPVAYHHLSQEVSTKLMQFSRTHKICKSWLPSQMMQQGLQIKDGDLVEVLHRDESGWSYGRKGKTFLWSQQRFAKLDTREDRKTLAGQRIWMFLVV